MDAKSWWRGELENVLNTIDHAFPGAVRAVYLHGSRAESVAMPDSDVDLSVVVNTPGDMAQVGRALSSRRLSSGQKLDAHVDTLELLEHPAYAFIAATLKYSGDLIRGEDVRASVAEPDYASFKAVVLEQVRKGISMLRDLDRVEPPVDFPDASFPFFGYEIVRKVGWYPPGTTEGTHELVAVSTYCASAWVVTHERAFVTSKAQAVEAIRRVENGERAHLVEQIYRLCRIKWAGCVPDEPDDRSLLRQLCERFLALENEILLLCS